MTNLPAHMDDLETGLEDFESSDGTVPRLKIDHPEAQFEDSLSGERFGNGYFIILGLVKQRSLWHPEVDDGDYPMCRSVDHRLGIPNVRDEQPSEKRFPWEASGFDSSDYSGDDAIRLPCEGCALKEWGSHPDGKKPYCSEQFTLPVLYSMEDDPENWDAYVPAVVTFQKTSLKPLKSYFTSFARSRTAPFQFVTKVELELNRRGSTKYSVPSFRRSIGTDQARWMEYSTTYRSMREFLTADPDTGDAPAPSDNKATRPTATQVETKVEKVEDPDGAEDAVVIEDQPKVEEKKASAPPPPATKSEPKAEAAPAEQSDEDDDDDLPF